MYGPGWPDVSRCSRALTRSGCAGLYPNCCTGGPRASTRYVRRASWKRDRSPGAYLRRGRRGPECQLRESSNGCSGSACCRWVSGGTRPQNDVPNFGNAPGSSGNRCANAFATGSSVSCFPRYTLLRSTCSGSASCAALLSEVQPPPPRQSAAQSALQHRAPCSQLTVPRHQASEPGTPTGRAGNPCCRYLKCAHG